MSACSFTPSGEYISVKNPKNKITLTKNSEFYLTAEIPCKNMIGGNIPNCSETIRQIGKYEITGDKIYLRIEQKFISGRLNGSSIVIEDEEFKRS